MKKIVISLAALAALAAVPLLAQEGGQSAPPGQPASVPVPTTSQQPGNSAAQDPAAGAPAAHAPAVNPADLKPVKTELVSKLDSKSAKTGDPVVVKTSEDMKTADGTEIPKGSKLTGHITKVQAHSKTSQNSELAVQIDQAQLKNGQTVPIRSVIESVSNAEAGGSSSAFATGPMAPGAGGTAGGGAMSGGSHGGASPGTGTQPAPSQTRATATNGAPMADQTPAQASGSSAGRVVAGSGPTAIRTTDIPNVYLASNAALQDSGVLFAAKDNVHLDGGTEMVLDIAPTGAH